MEITTTEINDVELFMISGRVDSVEAAKLASALQAAHQRGRYKIVVYMSQVEYMSSAGFRALGHAQRNSKRLQRGEVVLANVPPLIHEALDLVGFTEYFQISDTVDSAAELASNLPAGQSTTE